MLMIWSERRNFCFIHIPKTGGSAITFGYAATMAFGDVVLGGPPFAEELSKIYRSTLNVHKHSYATGVAAIVGSERFKMAFSVAVLRDPVARLVSYYRWIKGKDSDLNPDQKRLKRCGSFKEFLADACGIFPPQVNYVQDSSGSVMVSELLVYENLARDWSRVSKQVGVSIELPVRNKSPTFHVDIDSEDKSLVHRCYSLDYELIKRTQIR